MPKGDFIVTHTKRKFYPLDPQPKDICILDIAHALSNICRFTGHCSKFYSVAQHSILVSENVSIKDALWGLLHDASEAYISDVSSPIKKQPEFKQYREIEKNIMIAIASAFCLPTEIPNNVKEKDLLLLRTEARDLGLITPEWDIYNMSPLKKTIAPLTPEAAKQRFLDRFDLFYYFVNPIENRI